MSYCDCDADVLVYEPIPERGRVRIRCSECAFEWYGYAVNGRITIRPDDIESRRARGRADAEQCVGSYATMVDLCDEVERLRDLLYRAYDEHCGCLPDRPCFECEEPACREHDIYEVTP